MVIESRLPDDPIVADIDPHATCGELFEMMDEFEKVYARGRPGEQMQMVRHEAISVDAGAELGGRVAKGYERDLDGIS